MLKNSTIDAPTNYTGAIIFWLYILFALLLTSLILRTLSSLASKNPSSTNDSKRSHLVVLFSTYAILSFTTLSFNMLQVLIKSYVDWSHRHSLPLPINVIKADGLSVGLGKDIPWLMWQWSTTSNLFADFAEAIVEDDARIFWTQAELLATLYTALHMGSTGPRNRVPHLWAFFALMEILPSSFTLNLFYIAVLLSRQTSAEDHGHHLNSKTPAWSRLIKWVYLALLVGIPLLARTEWLIPAVLVLRALLLIPLLFPLREVDGKKAQKGINDNRHGGSDWLFGAVVAAVSGWRGVFVLSKYGLRCLGTTLTGHPAVSTLGWDLCIWAISWWSWDAFQRGEEEGPFGVRTERQKAR